MRLALIAALMMLFSSATAVAFVPSSAQLRTKMGPAPEKSPWSHVFNYAVLTDYADARKPRAYTNVFAGSVAYQLNSNWSLGLDAGITADTLDGQVQKGEEQTYAETVNPVTELSLGYGETLASYNYSVGIHGEPLYTEAARREGHQGLIGAGGLIRVGFWNKRYTMTHMIDGTSMINSFHYGSDKLANPDYFWTYKWRNDLRFARTWKLSYTFGAKLTRYLDGFIGYTYNNSTSISNTWRNFTLAGSYENGGFTDDGYVRLWYVDSYRRLARLTVSYAF
jgi:hypothetical protein